MLVFVFGLGVSVGSKRAEFAFKWADEYHRNFAGPKEGFFGDFMGGNFMDANGCFGQILSVDGNTVTVKDNRDNVEKIVIVGNKTVIVSQRNNVKLTDLKKDDTIVVVGRPNNAGQIEADIIRLMPQPLQSQYQAPAAENSEAILKN